MTKKCFITGAGEHFENDIPAPAKNDIVIAADGGYEFLKEKNIQIDIVIGDFDSSESIPDNTSGKIIKLNPIKDETDTLCAINEGINLNCKEFHIFGGTGGRTDHTIANIQNLCMLSKKGFSAYLYGKNEIFTVIHNSSISFDSSASGYISVFSLDTESYGVTESGLKYDISDYTMKNTYPVGVSNEFIGKISEISVKSGTLLLIYPRNARLLEK